MKDVIVDGIRITEKEGNCFFGHKWTKWELFEQPIKTKHGAGVQVRQRRSCLKCGIIEEKVIH